MATQAVEGSFLPLWTTIFPFHNNKWEDVEWKVLRLLFLKEFRLGIQFDYSQYMHRKLIEQLLHSLEVKPSKFPPPHPRSRSLCAIPFIILSSTRF